MNFCSQAQAVEGPTNGAYSCVSILAACMRLGGGNSPILASYVPSTDYVGWAIGYSISDISADLVAAIYPAYAYYYQQSTVFTRHKYRIKRQNVVVVQGSAGATAGLNAQVVWETSFSIDASWIF